MANLLSRVGQGLVSFGTGIPQSEIDRMRAERDISEDQARITQMETDELERQLEARPEMEAAAAERDLQFRQAAEVAFSDAPNAPEAQKFLAINFPEKFESINENFGLIDESKRRSAADFASQALAMPAGPERDQFIAERVKQDPVRFQDTASLIGLSPEDQDRALKAFQFSALSPEERLDQQNKDRDFALRERQVVADEVQAVATAGLKAEERINKEVEQNLKTEEGLRKEVNGLFKDFFQISDAFSRIEAAGTDPTAAGDLALIFNYMKLLDPGSTVREGEFANAQNSGSAFDVIGAQYNKVVRGERLTESQRGDFLSRASSLFNAQLGEARKTAEAYEGIATSAGVNVDNVLATFNVRNQDATSVSDSKTQTHEDGTTVVFND